MKKLWKGGPFKMYYEEALLKALEINTKRYWKKLLKKELKRIRKGHMSDPWINAAMRYWCDIKKWKSGVKPIPKVGDICSKCGIGILKKQPQSYSLAFGYCDYKLECNYCETVYKWSKKELHDMIQKEIGDKNG